MADTEQLQYILDKQLGWISAADSRLSLVLPLSTAMLGALAVYATKPSSWTLMAGIPAAFAIFFLCLSIIFCACASFPRTDGTKGSLFFFGGIVSRDISQFRAAVKAAQKSDLSRRPNRAMPYQRTDRLNEIHMGEARHGIYAGGYVALGICRVSVLRDERWRCLTT